LLVAETVQPAEKGRPFRLSRRHLDALSTQHSATSHVVKLLDRYVLRSFIEPFLLCFLGFLGIWLIFDLSDNLRDFLDAKASLKVIAGFYLTQLPAIVMIVLPVGLLLALLFSLSKMSRTNELIAQLTAGRSVFRIILPLIFVGLICTGGLTYLNYELAPHAEGIKKIALEQIAKGRKKLEAEALEAHLFRDRLTGRTWYVEKMRVGAPMLDNVHIIQQDEEGNILRKWIASRAFWDPRTKNWALMRGVTIDFDKEGNEVKRDGFAQLGEFRAIKGWTETPWRIASSNFEPQNLSVPELRDYLRWNSDFPEASLAPFRTYLAHRLAMPWTCLVVVLIAAPLGIVFNRRGVLAGVAFSIFIFFGMVFLTNLFLALGKGQRVAPEVAAWGPNALIAFIGVVLLYFRSTNRDLPRFSFKRR
jgi:lipopolysaccharide export system permease protein